MFNTIQFGNRIAQIRREKNMTQEDLVELVGEDYISVSTLKRIESGRGHIDMLRIIRICKALGCELQDLTGEGFNRMIADCEAGKIDLVITKSISRCARNTQDCLKYSRMLKALGIGIIFEKENISTMDASGELLFTILSSLAQEESRNISENSRWGIRHNFRQGICIKAYLRTLRRDLFKKELVNQRHVYLGLQEQGAEKWEHMPRRERKG